MARGVVAYIGIKLTPHSLEREGSVFYPFSKYPPSTRRTSAGGFASVGPVLFCRAQEMLLLFEPLCVVTALRGGSVASNMFLSGVCWNF